MMEPNPRKTTSVRRLGTVDVSRLRDAVLSLSEDVWNAENAAKPNRYGTLDATRHIVFRFVSSPRDWRQSYDKPLWNEWKPLLEPVLAAATEPYGYRHGGYPRIMLARMAPGGLIHTHRDENPAAKWPHKIHVPVLTNDEVSFCVDGEAYHFAEGHYSRWFRDGIKDEELADEAEELERTQPPDKDQSLKLVRAAIERRYTLPAASPVPVRGAE